MSSSVADRCLRDTKRTKDGKTYRYRSLIESVRPPGSRHAHQRCVTSLGELNDSEQASWTKALENFMGGSGDRTDL